MKNLLVLIATFLPALAMAHEGHGKHLMWDSAQWSVAGFGIESILASIIVAGVAVLLIKKYKSKH